MKAIILKLLKALRATIYERRIKNLKKKKFSKRKYKSVLIDDKPMGDPF